MEELLIQQELKCEENEKICGRMLLNLDDDHFREETSEKGFGYIDFSYDVQKKAFDLEATNAPDTVRKYSKQIITELWSYVKQVEAYWKTDDFLLYNMIKAKLEEKQTA